MIPVIRFDTGEGRKIVNQILSRSQLEHGNVQETVDSILLDVKKNGDKAVFGYTEKFDKIKVTAESIRVTPEEVDYAYSHVSPELLDVIRKSALRIKAFHEKQKRNSWFEPAQNGEIMGPLEKVGVYVPGGKAAYPSSVLMNVMPAHVAGVKRIYMTTPAQKDGRVYPTTIVAAKEAGVDEIFKIGGAQAIAALAYGTESVPKVDKICGPGNIFVALAKKSVYGYVNIDSVAGPSEILVLADESANPVYVAADLLSQAEHDELASAILITTDEKLALEVKPQMITAGASAYSRTIDFERMGQIARACGAYLFVDMAHIAGLVAGGQHPNPVPYADFVSSTTHKSLRGPRGGFVICKEEYAKKLDAAVFPGMQEAAASNYYIFSIILFIACRAITTALMKKFNPANMMSLFAVAGILCCMGTIYLPREISVWTLVGISGCMSLMFPTIYGIALRGLGSEVKLGAAGLIMAILGGAVITPYMGSWIDNTTVKNQVAYFESINRPLIAQAEAADARKSLSGAMLALYRMSEASPADGEEQARAAGKFQKNLPFPPLPGRGRF